MEKSVLRGFFAVMLVIGRLLVGEGNLAVGFFDLENLGDEKNAPYCKALPAMVSADLTGVKELTIVDRQNLRKVMKELALGESGAVDEKTAPKIGNLMGAGLLVMGSLLPTAGRFTLTWKLIRTESGAVVGGGNLEGEESRLSDLSTRLLVAAHQALVKAIPGLGPLPKKDAAPLPGDDFRSFGAALGSADRGEDARAREILRELAARRPGFVYAREELASLESRLALLEREREKAIGAKADLGPRDWNGFISTSSVLSSSMKYTRLLEYVRSFHGSFPSAPAGSPMNTGEMGLFYESMALYMLKRHEEALPVCEAFLKAFPASIYGTSVRLYLNQCLQSVKTRSAKKARIADDVAVDLEKAKVGDPGDRNFALYGAGIKWLAGEFYEEALNLFTRIPLNALSGKYGLGGDTLLYQIFNCRYQLAQKDEGQRVLKTVETLYPESSYYPAMLTMSAMFPE